MNKTKTVLIFIPILANLLSADCGIGTLKCSIDNNPIICDFINHFRLDSNTNECVKQTIENCKILDPFSENLSCFICENGHFFNKENTLCERVEEEKVVSSCQNYSSEMECIQCENNLFLNQGECINVSENKLIPFCIQYDNEQNCLKCEKNYFLKDDECVQSSDLKNSCYIHSNKKCFECEENFYLKEEEQNMIEDFLVSDLRDRTYKFFLNEKIFDETVQSVFCEQLKVKNCLNFSEFNKCSKCKEGYFVNDDFSCELFPEEQIPSCKIYANSMICSECQTGFYLNKNKCFEHSDIEFCLKYDKNSDTCAQCELSHYLQIDEVESENDQKTQVCIERKNSNITNCDVLNLFKDECLNCSLYFSLSVDNLACFADIKNCDAQNQALTAENLKHNCSKCANFYFLREENPSECLPVSRILDCIEYEKNQDSCSLCKEGKYFDANNKNCVTKNILNCIEYKSGEENSCVKCDPLFYVDNSICVKIENSSNCLQSDGIINSCDECKAGFVLSNNSCSQSRQITQYDPNCAGNISSIPSSDDCSSCKFGFVKAFGLNSKVISETWMTQNNCFKVDSSTGNCAICEMNYYLNESNLCVKSQIPESQIKCRQHLDNVKSDLDDPDNCYFCNTDLFFENKNNSCQFESKKNSILDCKSSEPNLLNSCYECEEGFSFIESSIASCSSSKLNNRNEPIFKTVEFCSVHSFSNKCLICQQNKILSDDKSVCLDPLDNFYSIRSFDMDLNPIGSFRPESLNSKIENCETYYQINRDEIACIKCFEGFVAIVPNSDFKLSPKFSEQDLNHTVWNTINECFQDSVDLNNENLSFKTTIGQLSSVQINTCLIGQRVNLVQGFYCIKCKNNFGGIYKELGFDGNGTPLVNSVVALTNCQEIKNTESGDVGFGYRFRENLDHLQLNNFTNISKCKIQNEYLVYLFKVSDQGEVSFVIIQNSQPEEENQEFSSPFCFKESDLDKTIDNCQVYSLSDSQTDVTDFERNKNSLKVVCLECSPGYRLLISADSTTCEKLNPFSECDITQPTLNKWLSACQTPKQGWKSAEKPSQRLMILFDEPDGSETRTSDCLVSVPGNSTKCKICKPGFELLSNQTCFEILGNNSLCKQKGIGASRWNKNLNDVKELNIQFASSLVVRLVGFLAENYQNFANSFCEKCEENRFIHQSSNFRKCGKVNFNNSGLEERNCSVLEYDDTQTNVIGCIECEHGYILNISDKKCFSQLDFSSCVLLKTNDDSKPECIKCHYSTFLNDKKECVSHFCKEFKNSNQISFTEQDECLICEKYHMFVEGKSNYCSSTKDLESGCLHFSPNKQTCVKCEANGYLPYMIFQKKKKTDLEQTKLGFDCVEFEYSNRDFPSFIFVKFVTFLEKEEKPLYNLEWVQTQADLLKTFQFEQLELKENVCIAKRRVLNCEKFKDEVFCYKCVDTFYLQSQNNICKKSKIENCKTPTENDESCLECSKEFFLSQDKSECIKRELSLNICEEYDIEKDKCISCDSLIRYLNTDGLCKIAQARNCSSFSPNKDKCLACLAGHFFNKSDETCNKYSVEHCKDEKNEFKDECLECQEDFWKDSSVSPSVCKTYSIQNCFQKKKTKDECETCEHGFFIQNENLNKECILQEDISFCVEYSQFSNSCKKCEEGRYYNSSTKECRLFPDGIKNCIEYSDRKTCIKCNSNTYLELNQCIAVEEKMEVMNCDIYKSDSQCQECKPKFFLNENSCSLIEIENCLQLDDKGLCLKCENSLFFDPDQKICKEIPIPNCLKMTLSENQDQICEECDSLFILSENQLKCESVSNSVSNCAKYNSESICEFCQNKFYLNKEKDKCKEMNNFLEPNCSKAIETDSFICDVCELGYHKSKGQCQQIEMEGCAILNQNKECLICQVGFYMDSTLTCHSSFPKTNKNTTIYSFSFFNIFCWLSLIYFVNN